jgi:hypothetical protein
MLPDDPETAILKRLKRPRDGEEETTPEQRGEIRAPARIAERTTAEPGYKRSDRQWFEQLLESTRNPR